MKDLKSRIVLLSILVAIMTALACSMVADAVARSYLTDEERRDRGLPQTTMVIVATGMGVAALMSVGGIVLGWWWLRPMKQLQLACAQPGDRKLAENSGLEDADQLAMAFNQRLAAERQARQQLAEALDREATAHAVHKKFIHQLDHELGGPLRQFIGYADRLTTVPDPSLIQQMRQSALLLEERVHDIIGIASETSDASGGRERQNLRRFSQSVVDMMRSQADAKGLTLTVAAPDVEMIIPGSTLTPVLVNLLANALRATLRGGVMVTAECGTDGGVIWTIADTGPGMPQEMGERVAAACLRGDVMPGEPGFGLGLTLAIAHMRSLNGKIAVISNSTQGATFRVTVPGYGEPTKNPAATTAG